MNSFCYPALRCFNLFSDGQDFIDALLGDNQNSVTVADNKVVRSDSDTANRHRHLHRLCPYSILPGPHPYAGRKERIVGVPCLIDISATTVHHSACYAPFARDLGKKASPHSHIHATGVGQYNYGARINVINEVPDGPPINADRFIPNGERGSSHYCGPGMPKYGRNLADDSQPVHGIGQYRR